MSSPRWLKIFQCSPTLPRKSQIFQGTQVAVQLAEGDQRTGQCNTSDEVTQDAGGVLHGGLSSCDPMIPAFFGWHPKPHKLPAHCIPDSPNTFRWLFIDILRSDRNCTYHICSWKSKICVKAMIWSCWNFLPNLFMKYLAGHRKYHTDLQHTLRTRADPLS